MLMAMSCSDDDTTKRHKNFRDCSFSSTQMRAEFHFKTFRNAFSAPNYSYQKSDKKPLQKFTVVASHVVMMTMSNIKSSESDVICAHTKAVALLWKYNMICHSLTTWKELNYKCNRNKSEAFSSINTLKTEFAIRWMNVDMKTCFCWKT